MEVRLDPLSWDDLGGDRIWAFELTDDTGCVRRARAGVEIGARGLVIRASEHYEHGDWTPVMLAYAAAALRLAPVDEDPVWVTQRNFEAVHRVVEAARRADAPLFSSGSIEEDLQLASPFGEQRPEGAGLRSPLPVDSAESGRAADPAVPPVPRALPRGPRGPAQYVPPTDGACRAG